MATNVLNDWQWALHPTCSCFENISCLCSQAKAKSKQGEVSRRSGSKRYDVDLSQSLSWRFAIQHRHRSGPAHPARDHSCLCVEPSLDTSAGCSHLTDSADQYNRSLLRLTSKQDQGLFGALPTKQAKLRSQEKNTASLAPAALGLTV